MDIFKLTTRIILVISVMTVLYVSGVHCDCAESDIRKCYTQYNIHFTTELDESKNYIIHMWDTSSQSSACRFGFKLSDCLQGLSGCSDAQYSNFKGIRDSMKFLCNETSSKDIKEYRPCLLLNTPSVRKQCKSNADIHHKPDGTYSAAEQEKFCSISLDYIHCEKDKLTEVCGAKAGEWKEQFMTKVYKHVLEDFHCYSLPKWVIVLSVIGIVIVCIVVVVVILKFMSCRKKAQGSGNTHFNNVLSVNSDQVI